MRKPLYTLILAVTLLMVSGARASRTSSVAPLPDSCRDACQVAFDDCIASGLSFHQCLGELRRCRKACR